MLLAVPSQAASQIVEDTSITLASDVSLQNMDWPSGDKQPSLTQPATIRGAYLPAARRNAVLDFGMLPEVGGGWLSALGRCRWQFVRAVAVSWQSWWVVGALGML